MAFSNRGGVDWNELCAAQTIGESAESNRSGILIHHPKARTRMPSTREPFAGPVDCPVIVSGIRVSLGSESVITAKMCTNAEHCIVNNGSLERIPECLLHHLTYR